MNARPFSVNDAVLLRSERTVHRLLVSDGIARVQRLTGTASPGSSRVFYFVSSPSFPLLFPCLFSVLPLSLSFSKTSCHLFAFHFLPFLYHILSFCQIQPGGLGSPGRKSIFWYTLSPGKRIWWQRFLPRCMRGLAMRILSVRLSVYSDKRVIRDKMEESSVQIFISYERSFSLVFWEEEWLVGGDPLYVKVLVNRPPLERNCRFSTHIRP